MACVNAEEGIALAKRGAASQCPHSGTAPPCAAVCQQV